jgi:hypothetical protein
MAAGGSRGMSDGIDKVHNRIKGPAKPVKRRPRELGGRWEVEVLLLGCCVYLFWEDKLDIPD